VTRTGKKKLLMSRLTENNHVSHTAEIKPGMKTTNLW